MGDSVIPYGDRAISSHHYWQNDFHRKLIFMSNCNAFVVKRMSIKLIARRGTLWRNPQSYLNHTFSHHMKSNTW